MAYPTSVQSFSNRNAGDVIQPSHVNDLQTEVTAIETALLGTITHAVTMSSGLTITGARLTVAAQPRCHVWSTATQTISSSQSTGVRLAFETIDYDIGSGFSTATNLYTVPSSGTYLVQSHCVVAAGDPQANYWIFVNGSPTQLGIVSTHLALYQVSGLVNVDAGTTIHMGIQPNSTVSRVYGSSAGTYFKQMTIVKVA